MKNLFGSLCLSVVVFACTATIVLGDTVVFDNLLGGASEVDTSSTSDRRTGVLNAGAFSLTTATNVTGVEWSGGYFSSNTPLANDSLLIEFFEDDNGAPTSGSVLATFNVGNTVTRVDSGFDIPGANGSSQDVYNFSADVNLALAAGQNYWISITNETPDNTSSYVWNSKDVSNVARAFSVDNGTTWIANDRFALDFRLTSTAIPEPTSSGLALLALPLLVRRRCKNHR